MKVELTLSWDTKEVIIVEQITSRISGLEQISQNIEYINPIIMIYNTMK